MKAPEKLYFGEDDRSLLGIYSTKELGDDIEYIRTDTFIEKACEFIKDNGSHYIDIVNGQLVLKKGIIKDFKKYMKGVSYEKELSTKR